MTTVPRKHGCCKALKKACVLTTSASTRQSQAFPCTMQRPVTRTLISPRALSQASVAREMTCCTSASDGKAQHQTNMADGLLFHVYPRGRLSSKNSFRVGPRARVPTTQGTNFSGTIASARHGKLGKRSTPQSRLTLPSSAQLHQPQLPPRYRRRLSHRSAWHRPLPKASKTSTLHATIRKGALAASCRSSGRHSLFRILY